eukprot:Skav228657  [mRNA]  locus=scaffold2369:161613:163567:- [translate_table: standard]
MVSMALDGLQQTIPRAEAYALLSVAHWIANFSGTVHIWSDSQDVVDSARQILRRVFDPREAEHEDIWQPITDLLQATEAELFFHKIPSHDQEQWCETPLEDFARVWNGCVDAQAAFANQVRPAFFHKVWDKHQAFRTAWKERVRRMTEFQVAIAAQDCCRTSAEADEAEEDVLPFDFVWSPNVAFLSVQLQPWVDNSNLFSFVHDSHFRVICAQFIRWISEVDISASRMRSVSLIEIYVAFRLVSCRGGLVCGDTTGLFATVTFASDFAYFKRLVRLVFGSADISYGDPVALAFLKIVPPQQGVQMGWPSDLESKVFRALRDFVGSRPVLNSQGLAKPWSPQVDI